MAWREVDVLTVRDGSIPFDFVAVLYLGISGMTGHEKSWAYLLRTSGMTGHEKASIGSLSL